MSWNLGMRTAHRWLSMAFTLAVLANFAAMGLGLGESTTLAVGMATLIPLNLLLLTGLYLFVLPWLPRRSG